MPSAKATPSSIAGYVVLPLSLPPLAAFPIPATHYLYIAPHEPKLPTPTAVRSLFLVNVPFDASEAHIKHLFSTQLGLSHGRIEDVQFAAEKRQVRSSEESLILASEKRGKKRKRPSHTGSIGEVEGAGLPQTWDRPLQINGGTAVIVFVDRASMDAAFKALKRSQKENRELVWEAGSDHSPPALGSARYLNHQRLRYPEKAQLLQSVNTFMTAFAEREASQARIQAKRRQVPDAEGFVTVSRGGRNGPAKQEAAQELAKKQKEKQEGLKDFYRFQMRERQKAKAGELLRKFEEDKNKVKRMREQRGKLKPE